MYYLLVFVLVWGGDILGRVSGVSVRQWAAVRVSAADGAQEDFGQTLPEDAIPPAIRRRMGRLERLAVRCTMGVLQDETTDELIFCSRYGNVEALSVLLRGIAENQLTSPMMFSGSVHNAAPGLVGQIRKERLSHTAIAAGRHTLAAALIESCAHLETEGCASVTVTLTDLPLPDHFQAFEDEVLPGLALAMRLEPASDADPMIGIEPGRGGALALLERLKEGPVSLATRGAA
jgi:hypothetical protein